MIGPLWDNLLTYGPGDDIYVDSTTPDQVTIRWDATNEVDSSDVNVAVTLFADGRIQFHYGPGNTNLTPTIGISRGDDRFYVLSAYDSMSALTGVDSVQFALTPGITYTDMGVYEFRGSSNDTVPPEVDATVPGGIEAGGTLGASVTEIRILFSEEVIPIDANASANYELRQAGPDQAFDTADDVVYALTATYTFNTGTGESVTRLNVGQPGGPLPTGRFRLTVRGSETTSVHDIAGNRLDGDRDGTEGGDYVRTFSVNATAPTSQVDPLAEEQHTADFEVSWAGEDEVGGSGIASYDIWVSDNGGGYTVQWDHITATSAVFTGEDGHIYAFYSVARDNVRTLSRLPVSRMRGQRCL